MFVTPFLIGLAGSLHCLGMCGPLATAVSRGKNISYNIGRVFTYGLLGVIVSFIGVGLNMIGLQQVVSVVAGVVMLFVAVTKVRTITPSFIVKFMMNVRSRFKLPPVLSGMLNGILPCGMTLVALSYCVSMPGPVEGFVAMAMFGLGTVPAMFTFSYFSKSVLKRIPNIQTALMIISAIFLIGRGVIAIQQRPAAEIATCGSILPHSI